MHTHTVKQIHIRSDTFKVDRQTWEHDRGGSGIKESRDQGINPYCAPDQIKWIPRQEDARLLLKSPWSPKSHLSTRIPKSKSKSKPKPNEPNLRPPFLVSQKTESGYLKIEIETEFESEFRNRN